MLYHYEDGFCVVREVRVQGGTFTMGRGECKEPDTELNPLGECVLRDGPLEVTVPSFFLDVAPVLYQRFECDPAAGVCEAPQLPYPYPFSAKANTGVLTTYSSSLPDRLDEISEIICAKEGKRLLREEEWEYVVTAAGTRTYAWGDDPPSCQHLWFDRSCPFPAGGSLQGGLLDLPLASYPPSPEGLYDLLHFLPHVVNRTRNDLGPSFDPSPHTTTFSTSCSIGSPEPACALVPESCKSPLKKPEDTTQCQRVDWAVRGGRARGYYSPPEYDRPVSALQGSRRLLSYGERAMARCAREAPGG